MNNLKSVTVKRTPNNTRATWAVIIRTGSSEVTEYWPTKSQADHRQRVILRDGVA